MIRFSSNRLILTALFFALGCSGTDSTPEFENIEASQFKDSASVHESFEASEVTTTPALFNVIATLEVPQPSFPNPPSYPKPVSYDTNRNGKQELIFPIRLNNGNPQVNFYEDVLSGATDPVGLLRQPGEILDVGDFDGDGKSDLLMYEFNLDDGGLVRVYESMQENQYPSKPVWATDLYRNMAAQVGKGGLDLDGDGKKEIVIGKNTGASHWIQIYENSADNNYDLVYTTPLLPKTIYSIVTGDFDNDGKQEFLAANGKEVSIYENSGDNAYQESFVYTWATACTSCTDDWTEWMGSGNASLGNDIDADGKLELLLARKRGDDDHIDIWETNGDNSFILTKDLAFGNLRGLDAKPLAGNVFGDGRDELVVSIDEVLSVFQVTGNNQYELISRQSDVVPENLWERYALLSDLDGNGCKEIVLGNRDSPIKVFSSSNCIPKNSDVTPFLPNSSVASVVLGSLLGNVPLLERFAVSVRNANNYPLSGVNVTIDFTTASAGSNIKLFASQNAGTSVNCPAKTISKLTNANGFASFSPRFGGFNNNPQVRVLSNGVVLSNSVKARSVDISGDGLVGLADLSTFGINYNRFTSNQETDFSLNGITDLPDLSIFSMAYSRAGLTPVGLCH